MFPTGKAVCFFFCRFIFFLILSVFCPLIRLCLHWTYVARCIDIWTILAHDPCDQRRAMPDTMNNNKHIGTFRLNEIINWNICMKQWVCIMFAHNISGTTVFLAKHETVPRVYGSGITVWQSRERSGSAKSPATTTACGWDLDDDLYKWCTCTCTSSMMVAIAVTVAIASFPLIPSTTSFSDLKYSTRTFLFITTYHVKEQGFFLRELPLQRLQCQRDRKESIGKADIFNRPRRGPPTARYSQPERKFPTFGPT